MQMPTVSTKSNKAKILKSYITIPAKGHVMSLRCEQPLDDLTVQVCLLIIYYMST